MPELKIEEKRNLIKKAYSSRIKVTRMARGGEAHLGGAFSSMDILTILYNKILKHDPQDPKWAERDRFILSAGHKAVALYAVLQDQGYFEEELLYNRYVLNSMLPEHPDEKKLPGIEYPTGSLGHGLPAGCGMAIIARLKSWNYRVFVLLGDGECSEGSVWESAMAAPNYKLDNLVAIVDRNGLQVNGRTKDIMDTGPLENKFESFGWQVVTINGHDYDDLYNTFSNIPFKTGKPSCIIADTVKCKGIASTENDIFSHHCHWDDGRIDEAIDEINSSLSKELDKVV